MDLPFSLQDFEQEQAERTKIQGAFVHLDYAFQLIRNDEKPAQVIESIDAAGNLLYQCRSNSLSDWHILASAIADPANLQIIPELTSVFSEKSAGHVNSLWEAQNPTYYREYILLLLKRIREHVYKKLEQHQASTNVQHKFALRMYALQTALNQGEDAVLKALRELFIILNQPNLSRDLVSVYRISLELIIKEIEEKYSIKGQLAEDEEFTVRTNMRNTVVGIGNQVYHRIQEARIKGGLRKLKRALGGPEA